MQEVIDLNDKLFNPYEEFRTIYLSGIKYDFLIFKMYFEKWKDNETGEFEPRVLAFLRYNDRTSFLLQNVKLRLDDLLNVELKGGDLIISDNKP